MQVGDRDGHGRYGIIDEDASGLLCHECGGRFKHLATHISMGHKISVADYREHHGLHASKPLVAKAVSSKMRDSWGKHADRHLADLDSSRDPSQATAASISVNRNRSAGAKAGRDKVLRSRRGRLLTKAEIAELDQAEDTAAWCAVAHRIMEDPMVTYRSLAESVGIRTGTAEQRMRRYRPPGWKPQGRGNRIRPPEAP